MERKMTKLTTNQLAVLEAMQGGTKSPNGRYTLVPLTAYGKKVARNQISRTVWFVCQFRSPGFETTEEGWSGDG
jgi:hypothetical protein